MVVVVGQGIEVADQGHLLDVSAAHGSCSVAEVGVVQQIVVVEFLAVGVSVVAAVVEDQRYSEVVVAVVEDSTAVCWLAPFRGEVEGRADGRLGNQVEATLVAVSHRVGVRICQVEGILE